MAFYASLFLLTAALFFVADRCRGVLHAAITIIALLLPCVVAASRDATVGTDVTRYGTWDFNTVMVHGFSEGFSVLLDSQQPVGYSLITCLEVSMFHSMVVHLFILQALVILPYYVVVRYFASQYTWIAMLWYMTMLYPASLNIMKQMIAVSFLMLSIIPVVRGEQIKFGVAIAVAFSFHQTALLGIVLYPLGRFILGNARLQNEFSSYGCRDDSGTRPRGLLFRAGLLGIICCAFIVIMTFGSQILSKTATLKGSYEYSLQHAGDGGLSARYLAMSLLLLFFGSVYYWAQTAQQFSQNADESSTQRMLRQNLLDFLLFVLTFIGTLAQQTVSIAENFYRFSFYGLVFGGVYLARKIEEQQSWGESYRLLLKGLDIVMIVVQFLAFYSACVVAGGNEIVPYTSHLLGITAVS